MSVSVSKDVIIVGGGIAGLWLLNRLVDAGLDAILLEHRALGSGQTIASQGMIHGGIKYALGGRTTIASDTIADMPAYWQRCLEGNAELDLRGVNLLSSTYYMWPRNSLRSRLNAFLGSKALRGRVETVEKEDFPAFFRGRIPGPLYRLTDIVLDVPDLLRVLSKRHRHRIHLIDSAAMKISLSAEGDISALQLPSHGLQCRAQRYIFTAGEGNESLQREFGSLQTPMQTRPLQMVMVQHRLPDPIHVHCVADQLSMTPDLTLTTHPGPDASSVWYLGGELAESGAGLNRDDQIARAREKLKALFPWCDLSAARWSVLNINRAEPASSGGKRPDTAFLRAQQNFMVGWPTKLTLAPVLADQVMRKLAEQDVKSAGHNNTLDMLPFPGIASTPWQEAFR